MRSIRAWPVVVLAVSVLAPSRSRAQLTAESGARVVRVRFATTPVARGLVIGFLERQTTDSLFVSLHDRNTQLAIPRAAVAGMDLYRGHQSRLGGLVAGAAAGAIGGAIASAVTLTALSGDHGANKWRAGSLIFFGGSIAGGVLEFLAPPVRWQRLTQ